MKKRVLVIRSHSGLSGDMLLAGLTRLGPFSNSDLGVLAKHIGLPLPQSPVTVKKVSVHGVSGFRAFVKSEKGHVHRTWLEIDALLRRSRLSSAAKQLARHTFKVLAQAESRVHGIPASRIEFHEVGALDSLIDICISAELFTRLGIRRTVSSPLPLCDGHVHSAHGRLSCPAPAVLELLAGATVKGLRSQGETLTPTAMALLKGFKTSFGPWPRIRVERTALVYGSRLLPGVLNGVIFALGTE